MGFPEDRVLVGVINRKRDLKVLRQQGWYRIPRGAIPDDCPFEVIAFYLSGSAARGLAAPGIYFYAEKRGYELVRRIDLLPVEVQHPRALAQYYKIQIGSLQQKIPPVTNPARRAFSFVWTTRDRFISAQTIGDLYREGDGFVSPRRPQ
jgi:hypothetical protein